MPPSAKQSRIRYVGKNFSFFFEFLLMTLIVKTEFVNASGINDKLPEINIAGEFYNT